MQQSKKAFPVGTPSYTSYPDIMHHLAVGGDSIRDDSVIVP